MDNPTPEETKLSKTDSTEGGDIKNEKRTIGRLFGYEISASTKTKNPMLRLSALILVNIVVLILLRVALNR